MANVVPPGMNEVRDEFAGEISDMFRLLKEEREELTRLTHDVSAAKAKCEKTLKRCSKRLIMFKKDFKALVQRDPGCIGAEEAARMAETVAEHEKQMAKTRFLLPMPIGLMLTLLLGKVNVTLPELGDRFAYKQAYERFKLNSTWAIITGAAVCLLARHYYHNPMRVLESLFHLFLGWYYGSVIIRELILRANGSRIRTWWLFHHYCAIFLAGALLTLPPRSQYSELHRNYMVFSLYLGLVQLLQYKYQAAVIYRKTALNKATSKMHITTEMPGVSTFTSLIIALGIAYLFQIWMAYDLYLTFTSEYSESPSPWQLPSSAAVFAVLGTGNVIITTDVVVRKFFPVTAHALGFPEKRMKMPMG